MGAVSVWLRTLWSVARSPAGVLSLGFLTLGGFACGLIFWGAFNTVLEFTNTETFCLSCHEMRSNVYQELSHTVHFSNRSGVRAICSDCHVPHNWTVKIARKMQASKEVWGHVFGTIDTRQRFLDHRLELAEHEWHGSRRTIRWNVGTAIRRWPWTCRSRPRGRRASISSTC